MNTPEELARYFGCGHRIEHGVMPVIVLTQPEAQRVKDRIEELEQELEDTIKHGPKDEY
jgi:hypothetical protein